MIVPTIYVDLDGVLADFDAKIFELFGGRGKAEIEKPNWGLVAEHQNIYATLSPMSDAFDLMNYLEHDFAPAYRDLLMVFGTPKIEILSAIPKRGHFPHAANDKRNWVHDHFGVYRVNFGPYAQDKQYHLRSEYDVLIDDMKINVDQWTARGGLGVLHSCATDTRLLLDAKIQWMRDELGATITKILKEVPPNDGLVKGEI
jgi:5'-nucleotidase